MKRLVTALVLVPIVVYVAVSAHVLLFIGVTSLIAAFCFHEYARLSAAHGFPIAFWPGLAAGIAVVTLPTVDPTLLLIPVFLGLGLALRTRNMAMVLPQAASLALGLLYCFLPWRCAVALRGIAPYWLVFALAVNWIGDGAAFYFGSRFGRRKLAPQISPGKSWEGTVASVVFSSLFGLAFLRHFAPELPVWEVLMLAISANIAGQLGDLCESALKRGSGLKDSGTLLPGHGGWLDRVDSSLFSLPVVYLWLFRNRLL